MTNLEAKKVLKQNNCSLSTVKGRSGRIAMVSRPSGIERSVRFAIDLNKSDLIDAFKVYISFELSKVKPKEFNALKKALNARTPRDKKIYGSRYDRIVDRVVLFEGLQKLINNK
jgi:hypothetical protein